MTASREQVALQKAADYALVKKNLRAAGLGAWIFGGLALVSGLLPPTDGALCALGAALLAVGTWNRTRVHPYAIVAAGASLALVGLWNIGSGFVAAADGGRPSVFWQILGLWQVIWGLQEIGRYRRFAEVGKPIPQESLIRQMEQMIEELRRAKPKTAPDVVELVSGGIRPRVVRARLTPEYALCLVNRADDVLLVERERFSLRVLDPGGGGNLRKVRATLGATSFEGRMSADQAQRVQIWKTNPTAIFERAA